MALWKGPEMEKPAAATIPNTATVKEPAYQPAPAPTRPREEVPARVNRPEMKESVIAAGLAIDGKIEGSGHVRIAGHFNGDVHVDGNLTIEPGAKLTGGVRAKTVTVGGELEGNIDSASVVELTATGVLTGDLKAGTLTVSAGSRMRGRVEFGWDDKTGAPKSNKGEGSAA
jgi:cytoskeletal protein CcmA (bactofilin family)